MAYEDAGKQISLPAGADLSGSQYCAVKVNASGQIVLAGDGETAIGILQNKPKSGQVAAVMVSGVSKMAAGGAVAAGSLVAADATGRAKVASKAVTNTSDAGVANDPLIGSSVLGVALTAASGAGAVFSVLLLPMGAVAATAS